MFPNYPKSFVFAMRAHNWAVHRLAGAVLALGLVLFGCFETLAQISINSTTPVTQNFDGIATTALPANWRVTNSFNLTSSITNGITSVTHGAPTTPTTKPK